MKKLLKLMKDQIIQTKKKAKKTEHTKITRKNALPITVPQLKNSCGKFLANDVNKIPRETINPPTTAVSRVDLFLQNSITAGEIASDTQKAVAAKHPTKKVVEKVKKNK